MADGVNELLLLEDNFEAIQDILEEDEAVGRQYIATANSISLNEDNFEL